MTCRLDVHLLRQAIIPFIPRYEWPQRTIADEISDLVQVRIVSCVTCHSRDIDIVQRCQMVEVEDVGLYEVGSEDQVAQDAPVVRNLISNSEC